MSSTLSAPTGADARGPATPPHQTIWTLANAIVPSACLHAVAELGIADEIGERPVGVEELAARCQVSPDALDRILRLLGCFGVFEHDGRGYRHTAASKLLRSNDPQSMRAFGRLMALPSIWQAFSNLEYSIRTDRPAIEAIDPNGLFAYLREHPDEGQIFAHAMTAKSAAEIPAVVASYDYGGIRTIADIGGGRGHLLKALLDSNPTASGILFDLPEVIEGVVRDDERLTLVAGDFFTDRLPAAECYLLMEVLQDWSDEQCSTILRAVRSAAQPGAKLLVIENMLDEQHPDARSHTLDVIFLAVTSGRQRTATELGRLFARSGWSGSTVYETGTPLRILEAVADDSPDTYLS